MTHVITVGLQQKIGQPNFGSLGASCTVELPLGDSEFTQPALLAAKIEIAYATCRQSIDRQLQSAAGNPKQEPPRCAGCSSARGEPNQSDQRASKPPAETTDPEWEASTSPADSNGSGSDRIGSDGPGSSRSAPTEHRGSRSESSRPATVAQVRAIHAICRRRGLSLVALVRSRFGVESPERLTLSQASGLIDQLDSEAEPAPG